MIKVFIDDVEIPISDGVRFKMLRQVNTFINMQVREYNSSYGIKIRKDHCNVQALDLLGEIGNTSKFPYYKNKTVITMGGMVVVADATSYVKGTTNEYYNLYIQDGLIDLFTDIKDDALSEIESDRRAVYDDQEDLPLLIADYGVDFYDSSSKTFYTDNIPASVEFDYLINRIFNNYGYTINGEFLNSADHKDLHLLPKVTPKDDIYDEEAYRWAFVSETESINRDTENEYTQDNGEYRTRYIGKRLLLDYQGADEYANNLYVKQVIGERLYLKEGLYSFKVTSDYLSVYHYKITNVLLGIDGSTRGTYNYSKLSEVDRSINNLGRAEITYNGILIQEGSYVHFDFELNQNNRHPDWIIEVTTNKAPIGTLLDNIKIKDVIKEWLNDYGLSLYKHKGAKDYSVYTIRERLSSPVVNYSDKYLGFKSEKYVLSGFGQTTTFKRKYHQDDQSYRDGTLSVENHQLIDEKQYTSFTYAALENLSELDLGADAPLPLSKFNYYDEDGGSITGNVHWCRKREVELGGDYNIENNESGYKLEGVSSINTASYDRLSYGYLLNQYYPLDSVVNDIRVETMEMNLNHLDVIDLEQAEVGEMPKILGKFYIKQRAGVYLIHRVVSFQIDKPSTVEFVRIG